MAASPGKLILLAALTAFLGAVAAVNLRSFSTISVPTSSGILDGGFTSEFERQYRDTIFFKSSAATLFGVLRYFAFHEGRKGVIVGRDGWLFSTEELERPPGYLQRADQLIVEVSRTATQIKTAGARVVIALVPEKADIYGDMLPPARAILPNLVYEDVRDLLIKRGLSVPDLRTALVEQREHRPVFLKTDTHWTPAGADIAARVVAAAVSIPGLAEARSFSATSGPIVHVDGDLMHYVSLGSFGKMAGLAPEEVAPPVVTEATGTVTGSDLFGDTTIAVNLIGTSYSANETWGFASSLKGYLGADVLNLAEIGQGPFQPMAGYLASGMLRKSSPRLVIWEIPLRYFAVNSPHQKSPADDTMLSASAKN
jgi:alginate O-acetyltransferase complex protein AlgJ